MEGESNGGEIVNIGYNVLLWVKVVLEEFMIVNWFKIVPFCVVDIPEQYYTPLI